MKSRVFATVASVAVLAGAGVATAPSSQAVTTCLASWEYTHTNKGYSDQFVTPTLSVCQDLNASETAGPGDSVKGWYKASSGWASGTKGFVWVPSTDQGWKVLLTNISNGARVLGEAAVHNQNVRYIY